MNLSKSISYFLFCFLLLFITSCAEDEKEENEVTLPTNLSVTIIEDLDVPGLVKVSASADQTNYFSFIFTDQSGSTTKESRTGQEDYQYSDTGRYTIVVRAHVTANEYIEQTKTLQVTFGIAPPPTRSGIPDTGYTTPMSYPNYTLVWNDEFDGTQLNSTDWNFEIGTGDNGWGNNEEQYYRQGNTSLDSGMLIIEAKEEFFNGNKYTSSRLTTEGKQSFKYGRIDIRAAMPFGQGLWPALWMLGDNFRTAKWPACGEIDIMEMVGGITTTNRGDGITHGSAHWSQGGTRSSHTDKLKLTSGRLSDEFHVYSIIWDSTKIEWYFDDTKFNELNITPAALSEFNQKFFFIFNVAVGGDWPLSPNSTTTFPQKMYVDYVRVFQ